MLLQMKRLSSLLQLPLATSSSCPSVMSSLRHHLSTITCVDSKPRIAIVGSGPGGFYAAQRILKSHPTATVDIYDKLPLPFGLVRFGVAPDHPEVKNVISTFTQTAANPRFRFHGNVEVGVDVALRELRDCYTAVILAYGAHTDRTFGIPGEDLNGVLSARSFVGWYNGHPQYNNLKVDLTSTDSAVIFGQGNVALDCARILLTPLDILKKTDIAERAVEELARSTIRSVTLIGRRGPLQVAFTIAELRELIKMPGVQSHFDHDDYAPFTSEIKDLPRARKRISELLVKTASISPEATTYEGHDTRRWTLQYLRSPLSFLPDAGDKNRLAGVKVQINKLKYDDSGRAISVSTDKTEEIKCGMVLRSIGYRCIPIDSDFPFDKRLAVVPNESGRVNGETGLYCSGWLKKGPVGVIMTTMNEAFDTANSLLEDLATDQLTSDPSHRGHRDISDLLEQKGIESISFDEWRKIDAAEVSLGSKVGKTRSKITDINEMIRVAKS